MRRQTLTAFAGALLLTIVPTAADARNGARASIYGDPMYLGLFDQGLVPGSTQLQARLGEARPTRAAVAAPAGDPPLRVYVVVVDGIRPQQVGPQTPMLNELKTQGTWYEQARSVLPAETLPNHAAMATGVVPAKNGIIANQFFRGQTNKEYMQYPEFLDADTIVTRLERA